MAKKNPKAVQLTAYEFNKLHHKWSKEAADRTMALMLAFMMEYPEFNCDADKIEEMYAGFTRYANAVKEGLIKMPEVLKIIEEMTGIKIQW
jgi:hypothetical protein